MVARLLVAGTRRETLAQLRGGTGAPLLFSRVFGSFLGLNVDKREKKIKSNWRGDVRRPFPAGPRTQGHRALWIALPMSCLWDLGLCFQTLPGVLGVVDISLSPWECPTARSCGGMLRYRGSFAPKELCPWDAGGTTNLWLKWCCPENLYLVPTVAGLVGVCPLGLAPGFRA